MEAGDQIIIVFSPVFSDRLSYYEFNDLPVEVRNEILNFFQSDQFLSGTIELYALSEIASGLNTFPDFNIYVNNVDFQVDQGRLFVYLYCALTENIVNSDDYLPVELNNILNHLKIGFRQATITEQFPQNYGNYLGNHSYRYQIHIPADRLDILT